MQLDIANSEDAFLRRLVKNGEFTNYMLGTASFVRTKDGTLYTFELPDVADVADRWLDEAVYARNVQCKGRVYGIIDGTLTAVKIPSTAPNTASKLQDGHKNDAETRKRQPLASGVLDYFPAALRAVAECSLVGNEQHNPGQPLHHARGKSSDHPDALLRHLSDRGAIDTDGIRHSAKVAWRALAMLQEELEAAGEPKARGAK
jgi:hypothetical protein